MGIRINRVTLENFRCFRQAKIDLSADVVAIYGRNGIGKTTIFDALEFALLGNIGRFQREMSPPDYLPYLFSNGNLRVRVDFYGEEDGAWVEQSRGRSPDEHISIGGSGGWTTMRDFLYGFLVDEEYLPPRREVRPIEELFRATILLSQDLIRHFIEGDAGERARILSCISGSAYLQKCLDKAKDVMKEAVKRKRAEEPKLAEPKAKIGELNRKISERETQISAIRERIGAKVISYEHILEALEKGGISLSNAIPQLPEDEEPFLAAIRSTCHEKLAALDNQSDLLAELEASGQQHPDRLQRRQRLIDMINGAKKNLAELLKKEEDISGSLQKLDRQISELKGLIIAQSKRFQALQQILVLKRQKAELIRMRNAGLGEFEQLQKGINEIKTRIEKEQTELEGKNQNIARLRLSIEQLSRTLNKLNRLKGSIPTYKIAKERIDQLNLQIRQLEAKREDLEKQVNELREQSSLLSRKAAEFKQTVSTMKASSQEVEELITRLSQYATNGECPLCGHVHLSANELQNAIAAHLKNVSTGFQEAAKQLQIAIGDLAKHGTKLEICNQDLRQMDNNLQRVRVERDNAASITFKIKEDAMSTWTEAIAIRGIRSGVPSISHHLQDVDKIGSDMLVTDGDDSAKVVDALVNHIRAILADNQSTLLQSEEWVREAEIYLKDDRAKLASLGNVLDDQQKANEEIHRKLALIERQIIGLGLSNESQLPLDQVSQLIEAAQTSLAVQESHKSSHQIQQEKAQNELNSIRAERIKVEDSLKESEQILSRLISEIENFRFKVKNLGLPMDTSLDLIREARIHLIQEKDKLNAALQAADRYEWSCKITAMERERNELCQQIEEAKQTENESRERVEKLQGAIKEIEEWVSILSKKIDRDVEVKIAGHQMEIIRLFRAMIPSPYLFDKIVMRQGKSGLELGLRYRDLTQDAGEPRFFLSSAQANILALSIFLSFAGRQQWSRLDTILLDDPVQHLDDLDAVAFLDNLRSAALGKFCPKKQIIVSTCDQNLYLLMLRKFSLLESEGLHFMGISLLDNGKKGAEIHYDIGGSESRPRFAEAV